MQIDVNDFKSILDYRWVKQNYYTYGGCKTTKGKAFWTWLIWANGKPEQYLIKKE